jgi:hypothetical protein
LRYISLAFWRLAAGACRSLGPFYLVAALLVSAALTRDTGTVTVVARSHDRAARLDRTFPGTSTGGDAFDQGRIIHGSEGPKTIPA